MTDKQMLAKDIIFAALDSLEQDERTEVMREIAEYFCRNCYKSLDGYKCYCASCYDE